MIPDFIPLHRPAALRDGDVRRPVDEVAVSLIQREVLRAEEKPRQRQGKCSGVVLLVGCSARVSTS